MGEYVFFQYPGYRLLYCIEPFKLKKGDDLSEIGLGKMTQALLFRASISDKP
jgi:hypothetical protein